MLCVDDEVVVVRSLRWLLEEEFQVETACGGREGIEYIGRQQFNVVISDQRMPGMSGTQFLARVKDQQPQAMRLLLAAYSDYQAVLDSINHSEAYRFINKPWNNAELLHLVSEAASISLSMTAPDRIPRGHPGRRGGAVLVLDDDASVLPLVKGIVGSAHQVLWARSVDEASAMSVEARSLAVMVCECSVKGVSTLGLISALKAQRPAVMTIVHTRERDARAVRRLINEGHVFRFLNKPASGVPLSAMLYRAIARHWELAPQLEAA
ncbi:response regulator [Caenimonas aquaedulcis]|uniref:Response regulator n=1 Tax=Caenimonas aquaedulcis TaxID=2793270 RepID=A0A931H706_9BURK|nr:response regulator [Caenimonas aquaedulcis]